MPRTGYNLDHLNLGAKPIRYTRRQRCWLWLSRRLEYASEWCSHRAYRGVSIGYDEPEPVQWPPLTTFSTSIEFTDKLGPLSDEERTRLAADYLNRRDMDA